MNKVIFGQAQLKSVHFFPQVNNDWIKMFSQSQFCVEKPARWPSVQPLFPALNCAHTSTYVCEHSDEVSVEVDGLVEREKHGVTDLNLLPSAL